MLIGIRVGGLAVGLLVESLLSYWLVTCLVVARTFGAGERSNLDDAPRPP